MKEIGSEFWDIPAAGKRYLLSGRTALEYIIRDILREHYNKLVLLPSYCCHTMIEPFVMHGFDIRFYDVYFDETAGLCATLPPLRQGEIFYYMTYFGFSHISGVDIEYIHKECPVIIEDRTHSWLTGDNDSIADYSYISFRKWAGFYGIAEAQKKKGAFDLAVNNPGECYCIARKQAMSLKAQYIKGNIDQKEGFLTMYGRTEEQLETDYVGYTPTAEGMNQLLTADFDFIRERRKQNADVLLQGLNNINGISLMYNNRKDGETPLFVPILVSERRDGLKNYLIKNKVYCPVHWTISEHHKSISRRAKSIYDHELSLICDQRYSAVDMERIVALIQNFFK